MRTWIAMGCALALLAGCGDEDPKGGAKQGGASAGGSAAGIRTPADWPSADERRLDPNHVPTPYSAAQIRAACGEASRRVYRMEPKGGPVTHVLFTYRDPTDEGCVAEQTPCTPDGQATGPSKGGPATWTELQRHASFPAVATTLDERDLEGPGGTLRCMHFVVQREGVRGAGRDEYWFAWDLPGPPAHLERYVNGALEFAMTLVKVEGVR